MPSRLWRLRAQGVHGAVGCRCAPASGWIGTPAPRLPGDAGLRLPPMPLQAFGRSVVRHDAGRQVLTLLAEVCMSWKIGGPRMGDD